MRHHGKKFISFSIPLLAGVVFGLMAGPAIYWLVFILIALAALVWIVFRKGRSVAGTSILLGTFCGLFIADRLDLWMMERAMNSTIPLINELEEWKGRHGSYPEDLSRIASASGLSPYVNYYGGGESYRLTVWRSGMFLDHWEWYSKDQNWNIE